MMHKTLGNAMLPAMNNAAGRVAKPAISSMAASTFGGGRDSQAYMGAEMKRVWKALRHCSEAGDLLKTVL